MKKLLNREIFLEECIKQATTKDEVFKLETEKERINKEIINIIIEDTRNNLD